MYFEHLLGIVKASAAKGVNVVIFFSDRGVLLTGHSKFGELENLAEMSICKVSMINHGLDPESVIKGIPQNRILNQSRHGDLIDKCDRYLVL